MIDLPDHPVIRNMERTGYPDGVAPEETHCPICGKACDTIYTADGEIVGCDECIRIKEAWDVPECFKEKGGY